MQLTFTSSRQSVKCPVCGGICSLLDVVDFNKSCEEAKGKFQELSGLPIYYSACRTCGFCFAPAFATWSLDAFQEKIYNDRYVEVDPDYVEARPRANASNLITLFNERGHPLRHLDYGGGHGLLAELLRGANWPSISYDPFIDRGTNVIELGKFDLVTAFEVFEHVPDVRELMSNLRSLLMPEGIVLFSTLVSDGNIRFNERLTWWYAAPRNGHISLFTRKSLAILARNHGFSFASFSSGVHILFTKLPSWAKHLIVPTTK